jgi:hypothetical protein
VHVVCGEPRADVARHRVPARCPYSEGNLGAPT